jgi:predicted HD phosphohydrolase
MSTSGPKVSFHAMKEGTPEDYRIIAANDESTAKDLPDRLLKHLKEMEDDDGAYQISRLDHVLQCATRAYREGANDDWIIAALMHDIGDVLAPHTHGQVAAEIIRPFVSEEVTWCVRHHGTFQMYYNTSLDQATRNKREQFRDHPYFRHTIDFCEKWDQCSFDPNYDTASLEFFEPIVRRVFSRPPFSR